ncbi:MAG: branched-chain amino acid transport system permease protein [Thermacetogenium sp.]|nr:branched-chain amino acid transport system permease protein [Thermacetogenium sp.]
MEAITGFFNDPYINQVLTLTGVYLITALGLHLITGITGQFSFGHAGFMSIGAYTAALLSLHLQTPFLLNVFLGGLVAGLAGLLLGFPSLRLTGDYLGITTLGFAEIIRIVFINLKITGGARGLAGIPRDTSLAVVLVIAVLSIACMYRIHNSRFGRALMAIREDELAAEAMGVNTLLYKVKAFATGTFFAGIGGGLYAHLIQYLNPADFGVSRSFELLNFVVLGGLGSVPGTILGTAVLTLAPEFLRFVKEYRMLIYSALMVCMMIFRPHGLLGGVDFRKLLLDIYRRRLAKAVRIKDAGGVRQQ